MTKYIVKETTAFKKSFKTAKKRGRDMKKLEKLLYILANGQEIPLTYKDHQLINSKRYINCRECHIESDWLLIYQIINGDLILLLVETGSHSDLFK